MVTQRRRHDPHNGTICRGRPVDAFTLPARRRRWFPENGREIMGLGRRFARPDDA